jgi:hypothetical protein
MSWRRFKSALAELGDRQSLGVLLDLPDDSEICTIGLEHEKFPHVRWLEDLVGNVEIMSDHHQIRGAAMVQNFLQDPVVIRCGLFFRDYARRHQILNGGRAAECKHAGLDAAAIGAGQDLPNRNAVRAEGFAQALGLLYTSRGEVYLNRTVPGRKPPYPFSDNDVGVAQQNHLAALP